MSLGLHPDQGGIGQFLFNSIQKKFTEANQRFSDLHDERRRQIGTAQAAERLLQGGDTRYEVQSEYHSAVHAANASAELIEETASLADFLGKVFQPIFDTAIEILPRFFQEVFDPALSESKTGLFEDSPAGFRLICKHDRSASSAWERIDTPTQFTESVCHFFEAVEREVTVEPKMRNAFSALMTEVVQFVRSEEFIEGALNRAQKEKRATPWAYVSGGTMQTLVRNYLGIEPKEFSRPIQTEKELLQFLIQAAKQTDGKQVLLMHSPTHAFLFYPSWLQAYDPERSARFVKQLDISEEKIDFLVDLFAAFLPEVQRPLFYHRFRQCATAKDLETLRKNLLNSANLPEENIDGFLYESLPVFSLAEARGALEHLKEALFSRYQKKFEMPLLNSKIQFITSKDLLQLAKPKKEVFSEIDWEKEIAIEARRQGLAYPQPILFGDTNWSTWCFGFVQNMVTGKLELWRLDRLGLRGMPMADWSIHFRNSGRWTIFL